MRDHGVLPGCGSREPCGGRGSVSTPRALPSDRSHCGAVLQPRLPPSGPLKWPKRRGAAMSCRWEEGIVPPPPHTHGIELQLGLEAQTSGATGYSC